jgi:hypothetical protein
MGYGALFQSWHFSEEPVSRRITTMLQEADFGESSTEKLPDS